MKIVEFYNRDNVKMPVYVKLDATGTIEIVNGTELFDGLLAQGIRGRTDRRLTPEDGIEFMTELAYEFTGSYFRASKPIDLN